MPGYATVEAGNVMLTKAGVRSLQAEQSDAIEQLKRPGSFVDVAAEHLGLSDTDRRYLSEFPSSLQEAIRAAVVDAIDRGMAIQIQFRPGYDFEVSVWEYGEALGLHVRGPYTGAPFPRASYSG